MTAVAGAADAASSFSCRQEYHHNCCCCCCSLQKQKSAYANSKRQECKRFFSLIRSQNNKKPFLSASAHRRHHHYQTELLTDTTEQCIVCKTSFEWLSSILKEGKRKRGTKFSFKLEGLLLKQLSRTPLSRFCRSRSTRPKSQVNFGCCC